MAGDGFYARHPREFDAHLPAVEDQLLRLRPVDEIRVARFEFIDPRLEFLVPGPLIAVAVSVERVYDIRYQAFPVGG